MAQRPRLPQEILHRITSELLSSALTTLCIEEGNYARWPYYRTAIAMAKVSRAAAMDVEHVVDQHYEAFRASETWATRDRLPCRLRAFLTSLEEDSRHSSYVANLLCQVEENIRCTTRRMIRFTLRKIERVVGVGCEWRKE